MDEALAFFVEKLLNVGKPAPACAAEDCVIRWVIDQTQVVQSIYDSALDADGLSKEDFEKVEELYKHVLQEIYDAGMKSLGALEV